MQFRFFRITSIFGLAYCAATACAPKGTAAGLAGGASGGASKTQSSGGQTSSSGGASNRRQQPPRTFNHDITPLRIRQASNSESVMKRMLRAAL